jgi:putative DNA primase/helicase
MNPIGSIIAAFRAHGLDYDGEIIADGRLHRFKAAGDHERNSWYALNGGPPMAGAFGCWKRGIKEKWHDRSRILSQAEWNEVRLRWQEAERECERAEVERHAQARKTAAWILTRAQPAQSHPYLERKGVKPCDDMREFRGALVLSLRDAGGELQSLQFISPGGDKKFLTGGRIAGCFFTISDQPDGALMLCEGYATGASIHAATGGGLVCAMNCHNLIAVAEVMRKKFPAREIIICADNDAWTDGNPGLTAVTAAAQAIQAKIATPNFADVTGKPTDFNDLHQQEGLDTVKTQIEAAFAPKESDEEILQRLAALPLLEYERCREAEAGRLGIKRVSILDKLVDGQRPKSETAGGELQGRNVNLADVELWPEAVTGADVLDEIASTFARYVALPDGAGDALALWTAHAHCFAGFGCSPRLNISSPEKGCGKTTLRDVLAVLVPRPLPTENLSVAVLFRVIESRRPTVLADECDAWLRDNEELRGLLNAGHRRGGQALRCEGEANEVRAFNVFAPAVLCGIGALPGTLHDRSIIVRLERAKPGEVRERFDSRRVGREIELCRKLARFCADNKAQLEACEPMLPSGAFNRLADNWRPLFAIAEIAGGGWPQRVEAAFAKLTNKADADAQGMGAMLLADIQQVFNEGRAGRMFSKALVETLCAMSYRPWPEAHKGKPISETWLARRLHAFGVSPKTLRIGDDRAKGYETADFAEAFARYLPAEGQTKRASVTTTENTEGNPLFESVTTIMPVTDAKAGEHPENIELSRCHASNSTASAKEPVEADLI